MAYVWRQTVLLLAVLFLTVDYSQGQTVNACAGMLGGIGCDASGQSCDYTASYVVQPDDTVTFTASATTTGWVAIGVSGDQFMPITDVVLGAADGSNSFIHDRFASARAEPPIDASQDITSASASLVDGVTTITFNRPRDSGDSNDITLRQDPCRFFLFAFSGSVNFVTQAAGYHGGTNRAASAERICIPTFAECSAVVGFNRSSYTVSEAGPTLEVCVDASDLIQETVTISATSVTTTADDFTLNNVQVVLNATVTQACVQIDITDDTFLEDAETFTLSLAAEPPATLSPATANVTITDDDTASVGFEQTSYSVAEGGSQSVCVVVQAGSTLERDVVLTVTSSDGTATSTAPVDYTPPGPSLTIASGTTRECITVATTNDNILEDDESFDIILSAASDPAVTVTTDTTTVTITEDTDSVTVGFTETSYTIEEGMSMPVACVSVEGVLERDITVTVSSMDDSAIAGEDYTMVSSDLTLNAGTTTACADIATTADDVLEGDETFSISLTTTDGAAVMFSTSMATVVIPNDDTASVGFEQTAYSVAEGGSQSVCVIVQAGALGRNVVLTVTSTDGTATSSAPVDYTPPGSSLTIASGTTRECITVTPTNDDILEDDESFSLSLSTSVSGVTVAPAGTTVTIADDDTASVGFEQTSYSVAEGGSQSVCVVVQAGSTLERDVVLTVTSTDGTATSSAPVDYTQPSSGLTIASGTTRECITVATTEDDILEDNESFSLSLSTSDPNVTVTTDTATVNITEDADSVTVGFTATSYTIEEGMSMMSACVSVEGGELERDITVTVSSMDDSAIAGEDYTMVNSVLTLNAATPMECADIATTMDDVLEGDETFSLTATDGAAVMFSTSMATVVISNDDMVTIGFTEASYAVAEGGMQSVCGRVMSGTIGPGVTVEVTVSSTDGTATAGADFSGISDVWTFSDTVSMRCITVSALDDDILEGNQTFFVNLTTSNTDVILNPAAAEVTITDNDTLELAWQQPSYTVSEADGSIEVCVEVSGVLERSVEIAISTDPGSATVLEIDGGDYVMLSADRTFALGVDSIVCVDIMITGDSDDETTAEMFTVQFDTSDLGVTPPMETTTVAIFDPPVLNVQPEDQTNVDPGINVTFTVMAMGSDLTYQWQINMSDITDDGGEYAGTATSVLTVLDAREGDEGGYRCRVMNAVGSEFSAAAQLTVLDPPTIMTQPTALTSVSPGDNITFSVVANGERLSYSWLFQGAELLSSDTAIGVNTSELMIFDVQDPDMGNYQCVVSNAAGSVESDVVQLALVGRPVIVVNPMDAAVESGGNVDFTCTATSNASLTFFWRTTASGVTLPDDVEDGSDPMAGVTSTLSLTAVTVSHRGDYYCVVENARGSKSSTNATLTVVVIDGIMPPTQTVGFGANATFTCSASGSPNLEYSWESLDVIFPETDSTLIGTDTANLVITNVGPRLNESTYRCSVSVEGMQVGSREAELITLAPVFVMELPDGPIIISSGDMLVLMCAAMNTLDSPNNLQFFWYFDNVNSSTGIPRAVIVSSEENSNRVATSTLTIDSVNRSNDGLYTCRAYNRLISEGIDSITNVIVEFLPVILEFPMDMSVERRNAGTNLILSCRAEGLPLIESIEILRNNVSVNSTTGDSVTFEQENLQLNDSGTNYTCRAVNTRGNVTTQSFELIVQAAPGEVDHSAVAFELTGFFSARLTWPEPETNNGPITQYTVSYCQTIDSMTCGITPPERNVSNRSIELIDLVPRNTYQLTIRAENGAGEGPVPVLPSNGTFMFNSTNEDDVSPINLIAAVFQNMSENLIGLRWEVPAVALNTPEVTVEMFNVSYEESGSGVINSMVVPGTSDPLETAIMGLESDRDYAISVVAVYTYSAVTLESSPAEIDNRTLPEDFIPAPPTVDEETPDNMITIRWPRPSGFEFLVEYVVTLVQQSRMSLRKRRQTSTMMITVPRDMTSYQFEADPFTQYTADVSGNYNVGGVTFSAPVTGPITFNSNEQEPGIPPSLAVVRSYRFLDLSWNRPAPNGIITGFSVTYTPGNGMETVPPGRNRNFILMGLTPNTQYTVNVAAINGAGTGPSISRMDTTLLGVVEPVITDFQQVDNRPQIRMTIGSFSDEQGDLSHYKIVVGIAPAPLTGSIRDNALAPFDENSGLGYYVAGAFDVADFSSEFIIGDGSSSTFDGRTFTNLELSAGSIYYAFIRLYSAHVVTFSEDSDVPLAIIINISDSLDPVPIIVPVALVAALLFIVFIILVVVAILTRRPRVVRRQMLGDGTLDGKKGRGVELRRTRIFSPVLNVGTPDVFSSACQPTTLICEASGTPAPDVSWTKDGEPLDPERFIQLADSSLFINDTDLQDEGSYVVTAVNSAGSTEQMVRVTIVRPVPPEPDMEHPPIPVGDFTEKIAILRTNDDEGLEDEYSEVELDWNFTSYAAKLNINKNKNRYVNIIPYDHGRVVLALQENTPGSDYINGSYIDGYNRPNAYIATQGPIPSTFPDFWRMVWEHDSPTIIMVTNLKEEDKVKCHQYWPSYGTTTYGNLQVTLKEVENLAEYSIRTFNISPIAGQSKTQMPVREVRQFHFLVWPDHGVPQYATPLLSFRKRVIKYHPDKRGPMVIHCSAGVGRTGTFIALNYLLRQIESEGVVDIFNLVRQMRFRRNYMVQTSAQYIFIHDAILESIMCGDTSIPAPELRQKLQQLQQLDSTSESQQTLMAAQFETLTVASPSDDEFDCTIAQLPDNMEKNRCKEHLPSNQYRVVLSTDNDQSDYVCASFVDGYRQRNAFMTTQAPLQHTTGDFWRMVWEHKSAAIVMLTEIGEAGLDKYWPGEVKMPEVYGLYQVELASSERDVGDYVTKKFKLSPVDMPQESRMVTQFHFVKWSKDSSPTTTRPIIDMIDELQRVQRKSGNGPITVHCDNGIGRTGAFCALYSVLERVKTEQVVDVFQAVKTLRIQRAGLLETLDQYEFVHKAVLQFLDSFADYQNFK